MIEQITGKLAVSGGKPIRTTPLAPWPLFADDEIAIATDVLKSGKVNYWTGEHGRQFEAEYAAYLGVPHTIALTNGTVALELALYALDIGPGDDVLVTSRTFIASASCVVARGARPVMVDVDRDSQNITVATLTQALTPATKAIIAVHLAGWPCDMDAIMAFANAHGLHVIEDCAQAHGATYKGRPVGSMGTMAAFSFCQDKILTTAGEGGLFVCHDEALWKKAWSYKDHGKDYDAVFHREHPPGFRWLHASFGTNWRLTEMQSAIGRIILKKLPEWVKQRQANAACLREGLNDIQALRIPVPPAEVQHAYYKFYAFVKPEHLQPGWDRDRLMAAIQAEGIPCFSGSCSEIYLEKAFPDAWRPAERLSVARELGETSLMFLVHPTLTETDMADTVAAIQKVFSHASR